MTDRRPVENLSLDELESLLYRKKRATRQQRLLRLKKAGRVVEVAGLPAPHPIPPALTRPRLIPNGALRHYATADELPTTPDLPDEPAPTRRPIQFRWVFNQLLLFVEIVGVIGFLVVLISLWETRQELNAEVAAAQESQSITVALPTPMPTPIIGVVVLPSGHRPPVAGRPPEQGEAGDIPEHLRPFINNYVPPPLPTPGPEQARLIEIPAIGVNRVIVAGDDWEQLKKGVGHHIGSAQPGQIGNMVLSAHNDIFGEIFRHLDKLKPGDEIIVSTEIQSYTYIVREIKVVEPTDVWVMEPTDYPGTTLISCYPYQVNNKRIVVFADLADPPTSDI
ncbi:MAG: class D sortase [Anaerolineae bacterium]|nr:class D sortase [Anaerolineae bacterium]